MELFPEVDSDVSIFSDASNSDCGSVFSDEPTTSELLEHMSFSEEDEIDDAKEEEQADFAVDEITAPLELIEEKSTRTTSSRKTSTPIRENQSPPKKARFVRRTVDGSTNSLPKKTNAEVEPVAEFKLRASSLRSFRASAEKENAQEGAPAPRQRSATELKSYSQVLSPNRFENRKKIFDNAAATNEISRKRAFANRNKIEPPHFNQSKMEMIKNKFEERANGGAGCNQFEMTLVEEDREEQKRRHQENMMKFERIFN
ncbi:Oidioi.mRNA.OKI2018_I69.XSR.g16403.t1.cds [Oikopleura dioica]|uniref:Oidioi.mRNA.OKI2018_I69.XSR.g16403.t1.cds n=1 Tax=Oikopleura dioica TaxID=34765 RepID=A0ABN7SHV1_OIKDI|nr:Oidioi.mRNA.OKI2018_I69.XSR.g16403.t1.cds [Oikopleura dioica]